MHCWKAYEICYKSVRHYPLHLRHVATLPWEIKNSNFLQIFSRYGKMQTNCILSASILILKKFVCLSVCCVPLQIQTFYQNLVLVAEYHVGCEQALLRRLL